MVQAGADTAYCTLKVNTTIRSCSLNTSHQPVVPTQHIHLNPKCSHSIAGKTPISLN